MASLVIHRPNRRAIALFVAVLTLGLDQLSKQWALNTLRLARPRIVLPGPINLTLVFNYSNAFGLAPVSGELTRWGLAALNFAVAAVLGWLVVRRSMPRVTAAGLAFLIAGAIGNALDRIRFGAVIDFIDASKLGFVWVFNVADVSIDVGIGLLIIAMLLPRDSRVPIVE
jgi:signal peptidase II